MQPSKLTLLLFCALLLFPLTGWADGETTKTQGEKHIYTVIEFESAFMNKKQEKLLNILGEPDERAEINGNEVWTYHKIIKDQEKLWNQNIMFDFGRVNQMWGTPPSH